MPYSAPSLRFCGCIVPRGKQCQHAIERDQQRKAQYDQRRPTARELGYDSKWDVARAMFLASHPSCAMCGKPARVVDHKTPHRGDKKLFWDRKNWQPLCTPCHSGKKQSMEKSR